MKKQKIKVKCPKCNKLLITPSELDNMVYGSGAVSQVLNKYCDGTCKIILRLKGR